MPVPASSNMGGPSTFDKLKMGAMMGGTVGLIIGFIFGSVTILRSGAGPNGVMRTLGQYMLGSGTTFACFMSIGSVIRTDPSPTVTEAYLKSRRNPFIMPRQDTRLGRAYNDNI